MIVKNESKIITRLLDSVITIIDSYCICDTGSTDATIQIIRDYFTSKKIPGEVFEEKFRDFGYNRTVSLERANRWGQYALLLDADMILEITPNFKKSDLIHDIYQLKQKNDVMDYYNTRIVRTDRGIKCIGVTHEYYDFPQGCTVHKYNDLEINDIGDGGAKADKFERDIRLLRKGLSDDPKNARYHFYLANTYRDSGAVFTDTNQCRHQWEKAIKWYKKRLTFGGWDEELFMSCYEIGCLYLKLDQPDRAVYWWLEAYHYRSTRAESLYEIVKYYREKGGKYIPLAAHFYDLAKKIPYPKGDLLFIRKGVYDNLLDYEYTILAYYMKWPVDPYHYLDLMGKVNFNSMIANYKFYVKPLSKIQTQRFTFNQIARIEGHQDQFYPSTPCIIAWPPSSCEEGGYLMNQRYVNYYIEPNGNYKTNYPITSFNRRYHLDHQLNVVKSFDFDQLPDKVDRYSGIEDIKIFPHKGQIYFVGTEQDLSTKHLRVSTGLYPTDDQTRRLTSTICQSPTNNDCEKNWCYFEHHDQMKMIYKWSPLTIGHLGGDGDGDITQFIRDFTDAKVPNFFKHLRGSSNGVVVDQEIWFMTHMVEHSSPRNYYHCIVVLDRETLQHKRHSILFKFEDTAIEYCLGFVVEDSRIIIGFSKMDRETIVCVYERPLVDQFLFP